jgi:hypothetical protein
VIGNDYLERTIAIEEGVIRTTNIKNKLAGRSFDIDSEEFLVEIENDGYAEMLTNKNFIVLHERKDITEAHKRIIFCLENRKFGIEAEISFELCPHDSFLRKWISLKAEDKAENEGACEKLLIKRIEVERLSINDSPTSEQPQFVPHPFTRQMEYKPRLGQPEPRLGQPLFFPELFMGLEYPLGYNELVGEIVSLGHYPGRRLTDVPLVSKKAVLGVAKRDHVAEAFRDYLLKIAIPSVRKGPINLVGYNALWPWSLDINESRCLDSINSLKVNLHEKNRCKLDFFEIDWGWADPKSIWEIDDTKFPKGFRSIVEKLKELGMKFGFWISLSGGPTMDEKWGGGEGYEIMEKCEGRLWGKYCLAGPRYFRKIKNTLLRYVREYDLGILLLDYLGGLCGAHDHGHLPGRPYSLEAIIDAEIDIIQSIRSIKPDIHIVDFLMGVHYSYSPWWVMYLDALWMGACSYAVATDIPVPLGQQINHITAKDDMVRWDLNQFTGEGKFFPSPYLVGATDTLCVWDLHTDHMESNLPKYYGYRSDNIMIGLVRGNLYWPLYTDLSVYKENDWTFLAKAIEWGRHNKEILGHMRPILGAPKRREVYGYANFCGSKGIICLRNPFVKERVAKLRLDETLGLVSEEMPREYLVKIVYPYHKFLDKIYRYKDVITLNLQGYETLVLEILSRDSLTKPVIIDCRYEEFKGTNQEVMFYKLWDRAGSKRRLRVIGAPSMSIPKKYLSCIFPGEADELEIDDSKLEQVDGTIKGLVEIKIPATNENSHLLILCEPENEAKLFCRVSNRTEPGVWKYISKRSYRDLLGPHAKALNISEDKTNKWVFFIVPLSCGRNGIAFEISGEKNKVFQGEKSVWLWTEEDLTSTKAAISFGGGAECVDGKCELEQVSLTKVRKVINVLSNTSTHVPVL